MEIVRRFPEYISTEDGKLLYGEDDVIYCFPRDQGKLVSLTDIKKQQV